MSVSLAKGQKVDLTKGKAGLNTVMVGLGWDEAKRKGGLFKKPEPIDCDASAVMCQKGGKFKGKEDLVYFAKLKHKSGSVKHQGDNLTGQGDGDDEQIMVNLKEVPAEYERIVFVVNIYEAVVRNQHFGMIENAFIRIVDTASGTELCRYNLSDGYSGKTAMICGELNRLNGEWEFTAVGEGTNDTSLLTLANKFA